MKDIDDLTKYLDDLDLVDWKLETLETIEYEEPPSTTLPHEGYEEIEV